MSDAVAFVVLGTPAPKGSKKLLPARGKRRAMIVDDNEKTKPWAHAVSVAAMAAMRGREMFIGEPLVLSIVFARARPAGHFGKRGLRPSAPVVPATKPDGDKLQRAVADALEGVVFDNDSRIVRWEAAEIYAPPGLSPGAFIRVWRPTEGLVRSAEVGYRRALAVYA